MCFQPCSERVLVQLSNQFPRFVIPLLQTTFQQVARKSNLSSSCSLRLLFASIAQPPTDLASVVQKEALYCAIGRCAIRMKDAIPFDEWLEHTLVIEARDTNPKFAWSIHHIFHSPNCSTVIRSSRDALPGLLENGYPSLAQALITHKYGLH